MTLFNSTKIISILHSNKQLLVFIVLMSVFRSAVADWYTVPTGSMKPTIWEGDRIVVNKMAYDLRLPFTDVSLFSLNTAKHGEIIVFDSKAADLRLIKRVVGIPGDVIAMHKGQIILNGQPVNYHPYENKLSNATPPVKTYQETLGDITHRFNIDLSTSDSRSDFAPVTVPAGHYLVLGDNRSHSADSRTYGFIPHHELKGKATAIAFSVDYDNYYLPRANRFFKNIYGS